MSCRACVDDGDLVQFAARVSGDAASVKIRSSRIEWSITGRDGVIVMTPISAIRSVSTRRQGCRSWLLSVSTAQGTVDFRVDKRTAATMQRHLQLLLSTVDTAANDLPSTKLDEDDDGLRHRFAVELASLDWLYEVGVFTQVDLENERAKLVQNFAASGMILSPNNS